MTVRDLIECLQAMDPDCPVVIPGTGMREGLLVPPDAVNQTQLYLSETDPGCYRLDNDGTQTGTVVEIR